MIRTKKRMGLCVALLALNLAFIWGNSLLPGGISEVISRWVGNLITALLDLPVNETVGGHNLLRKLAHFSEFACLGILLSWLTGMAGEKGLHGWSLPLLGGMMAACMDETIQTMIPERGPSVIDVWIDTFGVAAGIGLLLLGHHWMKRKTERKKKHLEETTFGGNNMKKTISMLLILVLALTALAGCAANEPAETTVPVTELPTEAPTEAVKPALEGTLEEIIGRIYEHQSVEFMVGTMPIDLADTSEEGLWALKNGTGLDSAEGITEAAISEAMIGSIPYSMALVRVADPANAQSVAEAMKSGIDPRKWICVEADDLMVCGYGDVVMLVMIGSQYAESGVTAQSFVDAFEAVCGGQADFVLE